MYGMRNHSKNIHLSRMTDRQKRKRMILDKKMTNIREADNMADQESRTAPPSPSSPSSPVAERLRKSEVSR